MSVLRLATVKFDSLTDRDTIMLPRKINNPVAKPRGCLLFLLDIAVSNHESNTDDAHTTMENNKDLTSASTAFLILDLSPSLLTRDYA
ncbi:MAG: hypothetical protein ABL861_03050 [Nitrosomonas sp.]